MKQRDFRLSQDPRMKLRDFAAAIGVHIITASRYEHGQVPSHRVMRRIMAKFPTIRPNDYHNHVNSEST